MKTRRILERRRSEIIKTLATMSSAGWQNAILADFTPLERELAEINQTLSGDRHMTTIKIDPWNRNAEQRVAGRPGSERRDCVVRAFTIATGKPYAEVHAMFTRHGRKRGCGTSRKTYLKVAAELGLKYVSQRCSVVRFLDDRQYAPVCAAFVRGHAFAVEKGAVVDIMDPLKPRQIVTGYYFKP